MEPVELIIERLVHDIFTCDDDDARAELKKISREIDFSLEIDNHDFTINLTLNGFKKPR